MSAAAVETVLRLVSDLAGELQTGGAPPRAQLDNSLERDLGFDSLERAELLSRLEKVFGVRLPPRTLATAQTPRDLVSAVHVGDPVPGMPGGSRSEQAPTLTDLSLPPADVSAERPQLLPSPAEEGQCTDPSTQRPTAGEPLRVRAGDVLFAAYAWALLATLGLCALLLVAVLPRLEWRRRVAHVIARAFVAASGLPVRVSGAAHFPPSGPITVVANHASYLDAIVLTKVLPARCNFVAKGELARHPATRMLLGRIGTHFVERVDAEASVLAAQEIAALARRNESFAFFAEGTFTRQQGLRAFRMGAFVTAASAGTPLVPVAIRGTRSVLGDGQWIPRMGPIHVTVASPILPDGGDWAAAVRLRDRTRAAILAGCGEPDLASRL